MIVNEKEIRANYDEQTIIVYQAYNQSIASSAIEAQTFVSPPFKKERMTWIKPSFLWMMHRSIWASKENQERILAIKIKRNGFELALDNACLSHYDDALYSSYESWKEFLSKSLVRIQWDPERDIFLQPLNYRSIQIGLTGEAVEKYVSEWIVQIQDITDDCKQIHCLIKEGKTDEAKETIPLERTYPLPDSIARKIGAL
jgi:hypothetical protein